MVVFVIEFVELLEGRQFYRVVNRTVQNAVVAFLTSVLILDRFLGTILVFYNLDARVLAAQNTGLTAVAVLYFICQLHEISAPLFGQNSESAATPEDRGSILT